MLRDVEHGQEEPMSNIVLRMQERVQVCCMWHLDGQDPS